MKSEWRVRTEYSFSNRPAYQVYRLKNKDMANIRANREVVNNCTTKERAEKIAGEKNNESNANDHD